MRRFEPLLLLACALLPACENAQVKQCHADMATTQAQLLAMNPKDRANVEQVLGRIEATLAVCAAAQRADEVADLKEGQQNLAAHVLALKKREGQSAPHALSPEQLAALVAKGDPACPKGHAYEHGDSKKLIQCTGPQLVEMNFAQAREHFARRGFSLAVDASGKTLRAEYGAEVDIFRFAEPNSSKAAACVSIVAPAGIAWQEVITRATGVPPQRVTEGKPLKIAGTSLPFRLEGPGADKTVHLGDCPVATAAP